MRVVPEKREHAITWTYILCLTCSIMLSFGTHQNDHFLNITVKF